MTKSPKVNHIQPKNRSQRQQPSNQGIRRPQSRTGLVSPTGLQIQWAGRTWTKTTHTHGHRRRHWRRATGRVKQSKGGWASPKKICCRPPVTGEVALPREIGRACTAGRAGGHGGHEVPPARDRTSAQADVQMDATGAGEDTTVRGSRTRRRTRPGGRQQTCGRRRTKKSGVIRGRD